VRSIHALILNSSKGGYYIYITRKLPSLVQPSDYYPLLLFHVGEDEVAVRSPRVIKIDCRALGWLVRESEVQVIFSSLLPVASGDVARNRQTQAINTWLHGWCHRQREHIVLAGDRLSGDTQWLEGWGASTGPQPVAQRYAMDTAAQSKSCGGKLGAPDVGKARSVVRTPNFGKDKSLSLGPPGKRSSGTGR